MDIDEIEDEIAELEKAYDEEVGTNVDSDGSIYDRLDELYEIRRDILNK